MLRPPLAEQRHEGLRSRHAPSQRRASCVTSLMSASGLGCCSVPHPSDALPWRLRSWRLRDAVTFWRPGRLTFALGNQRKGRAVLRCVRTTHPSRRWAALAFGSLVLLVLPTAIAWASQITYATGTNGSGSAWSTSGQASRAYNQVWHQAGRYWWVYYDGGNYGQTYDNANPTRYGGGSGGSAYALCANDDDTSGVQWTCQTTTP